MELQKNESTAHGREVSQRKVKERQGGGRKGAYKCII
jgi:hypothetical protein